ncbi:MAG: hypothetical protein AB1711_06430 [Thermodesulfobacteriota bacterium]
MYFILLFIYLPPLPPISGAIDTDNITPVRKPHGHYASTGTANAVKAFFLCTMMYYYGN